MAEEIDLEKYFGNFRGPVTVVYQSSTSTYIPNFMEIRKTSCGRTDVSTDGHFRPPLMLLGRLGGVDLKCIKLTLAIDTDACVI